MNYGSKIFEAPAWTWKGNELTHWFGFDMTKVASFDDKSETLEKLPRINSVIQKLLFRDLERFVRHMHNLCPSVSVSQAERWKLNQSSTLWPPWGEQSSEGWDVQSKMTDAMSTVSVSGHFILCLSYPFITFAAQSGFAHAVCNLCCGILRCRCPTVCCDLSQECTVRAAMNGQMAGPMKAFVTIYPIVQAVEHFAKTQIKLGSNYFSPSFAH